MQDKQPENLKRRGFLFTAGAGTVAAAAVVASGPNTDAAKPVAPVAAAEKSGSYEETRHVRNYYRTARV